MDAEDHLRMRAKRLMRRRFAAHRKALPAAGVAARSQAICERLLSLPVVQAARSVALFYPMEERREVDLRELHAALAPRVRAFPAIDPETRIMRFYAVDDLARMSLGPMRFCEPPLDAEVAELDVIVVPGLAFDPRGYRIGYGGGFYDRTLPRYRPPAVAVGVAYAFQLAPDLPSAPHDVAVDMIVTDEQVLEITA